MTNRNFNYRLLLPIVVGVGLLLIGILGFLQFSIKEKCSLIENKKLAWAERLANHPYNTREPLTRKEWKSIPKKDRPDLAMELEFLKTMDPRLGVVPRERLMEAREYVKRLLPHSRAAITNVTWQERGPNNVGGRTRALMFDPNDAANVYKKVWAGGVGGGLWYTNDITSTPPGWNKVDDLWDNIAISTIAYNPNNLQEFYVGTGEGWYNGGAQRGGGIWKTSNGGASWTHLTATMPSSSGTIAQKSFAYVNKIVVSNNGTIFAATRGFFTNRGGVLISTDGGTSWTVSLSANALDGSVYDRAADIEIAANGDIYASFGIYSSPKVYKSINNGTTWTDISTNVGVTGANRIEMACAPSNTNIIYAVAQNGSPANSDQDILWVKKSIDGGINWSTIATPLMVDGSGDHFTRGQSFYDLILAVHPSDPNYVLVGGIDLHRTTNGGTSWSGISHWYGGFSQPNVHADQHAIVFRPIASNEVIFGNDGGVYYSTNAGNLAATPSFATKNTGYNTVQFYSCATKNEVNSYYYLAGAQDNGSQQFTQPQVNATSEVTGGDGAFTHIDQDNPNIQTTSYTNNNIYRSLDGGVTFPQIITESTGHFINPSEYDSQRNIFYSAAANDTLKRVSGFDGAFTNTDLAISVGIAQVSALKMSPFNDVLFLGIENGRIYKYTNASTATPTLTRIDNGGTPITNSGWVSAIDVGVDDNNLMVTYSNYGVTSVWETTDGGTTWNNKEGNLPDIPIRWCLYNPNNRNEVLLATELGVWSADDFNTGTTDAPDWQPTNTNLANTRCDMLKYRAADKQVVVATHGRGLYTTDIFADTPITNFLADKTLSCTGSLTVQFTDGSLKHGNSWAWDVDNDGTTDYTTQNPIHTYSSSGLYSVKLTIASGSATVTKESFINVMSSAPTSNCTVTENPSNPNLNNTFGIGIRNFTLQGINNTTSHNDGHYHDYSCSYFTTLESNKSYDVTITTTSTGSNTEGASVYIDYNDNGTFETGELFVSFPAAPGTRTISGTTPATGIVLGKGLRLRVISDYAKIPTSACNIDDSGQAEDYTIYFKDKLLDISGLRLQGAMPAAGTTMRTDINSLLPLSDPYALGISTGSIPSTVVDWIKVELRKGVNAGSATTIVGSTAALLYNDGTVKAVNGGLVNFTSVADGNYYVAIQHRNHLGVIFDAPIALSAGTVSLDMSSIALWTNVAITTNTPTTTINGVRVLWGGDANGNGKVSYNGGSNDREAILLKLGFNTTGQNLTYQSEDVNMNAICTYNGGTNDRESILQFLSFNATGELNQHHP